MFKLHLDDNGKPVFDGNGIPLFAQDGGSEPTPIDVNSLYDQIRARGGEAQTHRVEKEKLQAQLKAFEGLDPEAARKAVSQLQQIDESKLLDAGKVEELKLKITQDAQQKIDNLTKALEEANAKADTVAKEKESVIHGLLVKGAFESSQFLREKTVLPAEFAYASLGTHFSVEYGDSGKPQVIAKDAQGNTIFSPSNPSNYASPEEAIRLLIEQHPQRDSLLKSGASNGGSGAKSGDYRSGGAKTISRKEFEQLSADDRMARAKDGLIVVD